MTDYLPIPGTSLARDMRGLGIVETDKKKIDEYRHKKLMAMTVNEQQKVREDIDNLQKDVSEVKSTMGTILSLLEKLAEK